MKLSLERDCQPQHAKFGSVRPDFLRVQPLMHIGKVLSDLGAVPEQVYANAGIPGQLLSAPENTISFSQIRDLVRHSVEATGCEHFGLEVGRTALSNPLGLIGEVTMHCRDVGTAITYFQQYFHLHDRIGIATRSADGGNGTLGYLLFHGSTAEADQIHDAGIAIALSLMRQWVGPDWKPRAVTLSRRKPRNLRPYVDVFGVVPEFEYEQPALHFDARDFDRPIQGADASRFRLLSEKVDTVAGESDLNFSDQVRRMVRGLIAIKRCTADDLATVFAMSRRHMNRKLASEGTSYRLIHEEAQRSFAERMLLRTDKSLLEISLVLGYSDPAAFSHAFKRWHGRSPSEWRNRN